MSQRTNRSTLLKSMTLKQLNFVRQYLIHFNATRAALEAGYAKKSAFSIGSDNLRVPKIAEAISLGLENSGLSLDRIKTELGKMVFGIDIKDFAPWLDGSKTLAQLHAAGVDTTHIESFSRTPNQEGESRSLKMHNKLRAFELLVRVCGMIEDVRRITGGEDIGKNAGPRIKMVFEKLKSPKDIKKSGKSN